ncbi:hypothetical protein BU23DRAFT_522925 [Bimuria novae-zelandiae CBS 107.79]|uniref:Integral membrane protein n=1 Tax=Bimuria novae-zelandiae CBS 107.79 TaxID=1447943 RepID=A0A6A5VS27_9PLEO|nr:hypothetical protein BU23DRAFT_522925 [Bimuria novae-zelandiae CBS 107.79]
MALPERHLIDSAKLPVESTSVRTTVVCLCLFYMFLIALGQGLRYGRMFGRRSWSKVLESLILVQCMICVAYVSTVAILEAGLSMANKAQCQVAIRLCIGLYAGGKIALYLFFNERIHILRAPFMSRLLDPVWVVGTIAIIAGFGGVQAFASVAPMASFDTTTGQCLIGIAADASISVIVVDSVISSVLHGWIGAPSICSGWTG